MQTNALPGQESSINLTGCCPKFDPEGWDGQDLHFEDKPFVRATTRSLMHVPIDMGKVFARVQGRIEATGARDADQGLVMSRDVSPWQGEHFFAVSQPVEGEEMTAVSGDFVTRVFEGPYSEARYWEKEMQDLARERGSEPKRVFFFYTTCPKCAKIYGKNPVVGIVEV